MAGSGPPGASWGFLGLLCLDLGLLEFSRDSWGVLWLDLGFLDPGASWRVLGPPEDPVAESGSPGVPGVFLGWFRGGAWRVPWRSGVLGQH